MNTNRNPVGWFEIYVQDMERAKTFYQKTLEAGGAAGALVKMEGKDSGVGGTLIYFSCEDCAVEAARAAENGGKIQKEKISIGEYGFIVLVSDSEGNLIGLHSMK